MHAIATASLTTIGLSALVAVILLSITVVLAMADPIQRGPKDANLQLQASVTKTATFSSTGIDLGSGFSTPAPGRAYQADIRVSAIDIASGDESYIFTVQDSPDNSTWTTRSGGLTLLSTASATVGAYSLGCHILNRYVRLVMTASGTTPSITYEAYLDPHAN